MFQRSVLIALLLLALAATADVPRTILYQGRLTDNGTPINGSKYVSFTIYSGGGNPLWSSGVVEVHLTDGLFTVELGASPQSPLPPEPWSQDTALTLGITIPPNPEISPRLRFNSTGYAFHAKTAESAYVGGGWRRDGDFVRLDDQTDSVGIGTNEPNAKVGVIAVGNQVGVRVVGESQLGYGIPAVEVSNLVGPGAVFRTGADYMWPISPVPAIYGFAVGSDHNAAWLASYSDARPTLLVAQHMGAPAIQTWSTFGKTLEALLGTGIISQDSSVNAVRAESAYKNGQAFVLSSAYTGNYITDHVAVNGYSKPADYYGIGGQFEGGYIGVEGWVSPTGAATYYGVYGAASGGTGVKIGLSGYADGQGSNYGVYGQAYSGSVNRAGYFAGDVEVTGTIYKSAGLTSVDHPDDPANKYLRQADVVSDDYRAVYDGTVILDATGAAEVSLPAWVESFCGDFRYQLTCVGGYAPVYIASEMADGRFTIAGGKPGLKVCWQVTGLRHDQFAQTNPIEVEKKKSGTEAGKYLHPELFGYGVDKSVSPNLATDAEQVAKQEAVRVAAAEMAKPTPLPERPEAIERK